MDACVARAHTLRRDVSVGRVAAIAGEVQPCWRREPGLLVVVAETWMIAIGGAVSYCAAIAGTGAGVEKESGMPAARSWLPGVMSYVGCLHLWLKENILMSA